MSSRIVILVLVTVLTAGCSAPGPVPTDTQTDTPSEQTPSPAVDPSGATPPDQTLSPPVDSSSATPPDQTLSPPVDSSSATPPYLTPPNQSPMAEPPTIRVEGGRLAAEHERLFQRVTRRRGLDVQPPERIRVIDPAAANTPTDPPRFLRLLGVRGSDSGPTLAGQTIGTELVRINERVATAPRIDGVLVHEYTHVIQNRRGATGRMFESGTMETIPPFGVERPILIRTVREGAATYSADQYQRDTAGTLRQGRRYETLYREQESAAGRYVMAPYWFGYRYVADRLSEGDSLESIYSRPPRTTEAIIHRYEPGAEPPSDLSVTVQTNRSEQYRRGRVGELGTRLALSAGVNRSRAATAASGWGNDVLITVLNDSERGYVWVARWDDSANGTEFRSALTASLDRTATRTDRGWRDGTTTYRVRQGDARTTVVTVGTPAFVRNTSVTVEQPVVVEGRSNGIDRSGSRVRARTLARIGY